jgi:hypothetical protein
MAEVIGGAVRNVVESRTNCNGPSEGENVVRSYTNNGWVFRFERGLCPGNLLWGEVRKGGGAPLRGKFRFERGLCPRNVSWGEVRKGGGAPLRGN